MRPKIIASYRLIMASVVCAAVIAQLMSSIEYHRSIANFFSFFTIESNIIGTSVIAISAFAVLAGKKWKHEAMLRGAATTYMLVTGIIFTLLLSGLAARLQTTIPWVNNVLHHIFPIFMALDWIIDPPKQLIRFKHALLWLIFPVAYVTYSLVRGPLVDWYPYPFLDPADGGYLKLAITCLVMFAGGIVLIGALLAIQRLRRPELKKLAKKRA